MKYYLNEECTSPLIESGPRGEQALRECLCDLIYKYCKYYPNAAEFMLHHKDGHHNHNNIDNLILLPTYLKSTAAIGKQVRNPNTVLHNAERQGKISFKKLAGLSSTAYDDYLTKLELLVGIDVWKSMKAGSLVNSKNNPITKADLEI